VAVRRLANPVTFCDGHEVFLVAASGQIRMAANSPSGWRFVPGRERHPGGDNDVLVSATTATPTQSRTSFSASLGTTKDAIKIGKSLFPVHRKATISSSAASKV
jgi:hypothetical protein